jgi:hypothetical protein
MDEQQQKEDISSLLLGTMDTETRRKKRLDRLARSSSQRPTVIHSEVEFLQQKLQRQQQKREGRQKVFIASVAEPMNPLGDSFVEDPNQYHSILSDAPAILLQSGAGTGKTTVLAGRIAYLIRTKQVEPHNMIILSFTRRDAEALKDKAMDILFKNHTYDERSEDDFIVFTRESLKEQLWCGTIHSFAFNILKKYDFHEMPLRIISSKEMKNRVRHCLGRIHGSEKERMMLYRAAMEQSKQSIGTLVNNIIRCLELWKEAGVLSTPYAYTIQNIGMARHNEIGQDDYIELAMRLGIPQDVALLALDISGDYQVRCFLLNVSIFQFFLWEQVGNSWLVEQCIVSNNDRLCMLARERLTHQILHKWLTISSSIIQQR